MMRLVGFHHRVEVPVAEALMDLESRCSHIPFSGMAIAHGLDSFLIDWRNRGWRECGWAALFRVWLVRVRRFLPFGRKGSVQHVDGDRFFFYLMADAKHLSDLIRPIVERVGGGRSCVFSAVRPCSFNASQYGRTDIPFDWWGWSADYRNFAKKFRCEVLAWCRDWRVDKAVVPFVENQMLLTSQVASSFDGLMRIERPRWALVDYDRNVQSVAFVVAAQKNRVPVATLVHGVLNPPLGYLPVVADRVYCWGEMQREQFVSRGTAPEKVVVAGCTRMSSTSISNVKEVRERLGIPMDGRILLVVDSPGALWAEREIFRYFAEGLKDEPGWVGVVRLHPSRTTEDLIAFRKAFSGLRFTAKSDATLDEMLSVSDAVAIMNSGVGADALVKGCPVMVVDIMNVPLMSSWDLVEKAHVPVVHDLDDLHNLLDRLAEDEVFKKKLQADALLFARSFCKRVGDDAAEFIYNDLMKGVK